jgi:hypothetical protein
MECGEWMAQNAEDNALAWLRVYDSQGNSQVASVASSLRLIPTTYLPTVSIQLSSAQLESAGTNRSATPADRYRYVLVASAAVDELLSPLPGCRPTQTTAFQTNTMRGAARTAGRRGACQCGRGNQGQGRALQDIDAKVLFQSHQEGRFAETTSEDTGKDGKSPSCPPTT